MRLAFDDGRTFDGDDFGAARDVRGEVVFTTAPTGYVETLTDPSYRGQIVVFSYPLLGNYGVPEPPFESSRVQALGVVVSHLATLHSHHSSVRSLGAWLTSSGVPAITGVDTRALTRYLRSSGTRTGTLSRAGATDYHDIDMRTVADAAAPLESSRHGSGEPRILLVDAGAKDSLVRSLVSRGASVLRAPFCDDWERHLGEIDGVVLGSGPGDPADLSSLVERVKTLLARRVPTLGVCLGHQILALAAGAETYKLPYGHRSHNQPVVDHVTGRAYVTSQNHGYAVRESTIGGGFVPWFSNLNDGSNEGMRHERLPFSSVQFHPEGSAGPEDTAFVFDELLASARAASRDETRA